MTQLFAFFKRGNGSAAPYQLKNKIKTHRADATKIQAAHKVLSNEHSNHSSQCSQWLLFAQTVPFACTPHSSLLIVLRFRNLHHPTVDRNSTNFLCSDFFVEAKTMRVMYVRTSDLKASSLHLLTMLFPWIKDKRPGRSALRAIGVSDVQVVSPKISSFNLILLFSLIYCDFLSISNTVHFVSLS